MSATNGLTIRWLTLALGLLVAFGSVFAYVQSTYVPRDEYENERDYNRKMLEEIRGDVKKLIQQSPPKWEMPNARPYSGEKPRRGR